MQGVVIRYHHHQHSAAMLRVAGSRGLLGDNSAPEQDFALISVVIIKCYTDRICHCQTLGRAGELIQFNQFHGTFVMKNAGNVLLCSHTTRWSPRYIQPSHSINLAKLYVLTSLPCSGWVVTIKWPGQKHCFICLS